MAIVVNLDVMLARRKMRSRELAALIGISEQNVSLLKSGKVRFLGRVERSQLKHLYHSAAVFAFPERSASRCSSNPRPRTPLSAFPRLRSSTI